MSARSTYTWVCTACGRRVPQREPRCHCGARHDAQAGSRPQAVQGIARVGTTQSAVRAFWSSCSWDVRAMLAGALLVVVVGLAQLVVAPAPPPSGPALLGTLDPPLQRPGTPAPAFKLPWWK